VANNKNVTFIDIHSWDNIHVIVQPHTAFHFYLFRKYRISSSKLKAALRQQEKDKDFMRCTRKSLKDGQRRWFHRRQYQRSHALLTSKNLLKALKSNADPPLALELLEAESSNWRPWASPPQSSCGPEFPGIRLGSRQDRHNRQEQESRQNEWLSHKHGRAWTRVLEFFACCQLEWPPKAPVQQ